MTNIAKASRFKGMGEAWAVTLTASLFFFYIFIQLSSLNAISDDLMRDFHVTGLELGTLASMFFYANAGFLIPAGLLLDRYSTKWILVMASALSTLGTFIFATAHEFYIAEIGRFLVGTSAAFCFLSCVRVASRWFSPHQMAFVTGIVVTMAMLGGLTAQAPFHWLVSLLGWRQAMAVDVGLGVVIVIAIMLIVRDHPPHVLQSSEESSSRLPFWKSLWQVLTNKNNWLGGLYTSLLNFPVFLLGALWGIRYLVTVHHLSAQEASFATTVFFLGVIFGAPAFGWFSDHLGRRILPMMIGALLSLIVIVLLMFVPDLSLTEIMGLFFLIGFVTSSQVLSYPTVAELNPYAVTSTALSIVSTTIMASGAFVSPFFGALLDWQWDHTIMDGVPVYAASDFMNAMMIMPVSFVLGLIVAFFIKETHCEMRA